MKINTVKNFISDAFKSLRRNKTISIASALTVAATLFIFGVFMLVAINVNKQVDNVQSKVEVVVFLKDDITYSDQRGVETKLREVSGVKDVIYESKGEALVKFKDQLGDNKALLDSYTNDKNPMPNSFIVKIETPEVAYTVEDSMNNMPGVEEIGNQKDLVDKVAKISSTIKWVGVAIFIILTGVSLFLIGNTIKLTVFSRRREIGIMKFVGATDWFIRWPFIIEGVVIGVIGAIFSNLVLFGAYKMFFNKMISSLITSQLVTPGYIVSYLLAEFLLAGILVGAVGSFISLRKFLDV
ncbi:permease-like cell division protein FtsX [Clostridium frigidicarnis]|uniref:Cell division protein FtsX n=1 Tax=Clostridium frigidicarnis TaxID=84698 RepID=A0A1I1B7K2_9CLOT|nr:permease-like cell division protein FtsX [Clostridium frigidicarnis]SFB46365.1 cell division transport system permease protein [Clostridium frigidicarnis]